MVSVFDAYTRPQFAGFFVYGRGMFRRMVRAISIIRPTPP
jgi:hypothetical protein